MKLLQRLYLEWMKNTIAKVYELVVEAGVYRAESIKVAEAAKVIENSQRDINIAFMNELSIIFNMMDIDTNAVLKAAGTKWNFLNFKPGLVGGHCIGVDPYYLTHKAEELGYHSQVILSGRRINDDMGKYIGQNLVKKLIKSEIPVQRAKVAVLGLTFKEDCPDVRNSKVIDIINELKDYGIDPLVIDPQASKEDAQKTYNISLSDMDELEEMDAIIIAVGHKQFLNLQESDWSKFFRKTDNGRKIIIDVKGILDRKEYESKGYTYWRL